MASSLLLAPAALWSDRLRLEAVVCIGWTLVVAGWSEAASKLYSVEIWRSERKMRAVEGRRGW